MTEKCRENEREETGGPGGCRASGRGGMEEEERGEEEGREGFRERKG